MQTWSAECWVFLELLKLLAMPDLERVLVVSGSMMWCAQGTKPTLRTVSTQVLERPTALITKMPESFAVPKVSSFRHKSIKNKIAKAFKQLN